MEQVSKWTIADKHLQNVFHFAWSQRGWFFAWGQRGWFLLRWPDRSAASGSGWTERKNRCDRHQRDGQRANMYIFSPLRHTHPVKRRRRQSVNYQPSEFSVWDALRPAPPLSLSLPLIVRTAVDSAPSLWCKRQFGFHRCGKLKVNSWWMSHYRWQKQIEEQISGEELRRRCYMFYS